MRSVLRRDLLVDQRLDVLVEHQLLLVGQILEAAERILEGVVAELVAELLQLVAERGAARQLAERQRRLRQTRRSPAS